MTEQPFYCGSTFDSHNKELFAVHCASYFTIKLNVMAKIYLMSVTISAYTRSLVRLYLQLFVGGCMSYYVI